MKAAPRDKPDLAEAVTLTAAGTDHLRDNPPSAAVDGKPETGWMPVPPGRTHVIVFTRGAKHRVPRRRPPYVHPGAEPGRDQATGRPLSGAFPPAGDRRRPAGARGAARASCSSRRDGKRFSRTSTISCISSTRARARRYWKRRTGIPAPPPDKISAARSVSIPRFLGEIRIRREPGRGEFRYLQFAWKKSGGEAIGLQLAHEHEYGPEKPGGPTFRYHAGPYKPWGRSRSGQRQAAGRLGAGDARPLR